MLGNSIALLTLALMIASEGRRAEGAWRPGLYSLAAVVALVALALDPIANQLPVVGATLSAIFGNPLAWFVLFMALFFVLRPFWSRPDPNNQPIPRDKLNKSFEVLVEHVAEVKAEIEVAKEGKGSLREGIQSFMAVGMSLTTELHERLVGETKKLQDEIEAIRTKQGTIIEDYQTTLGGLSKADERHKAIEAGLGDVRRGCAKLEGQIEENEKYLRESLHAVRAREMLSELAREIEFDAAQLYDRLNGGEHYTSLDWDQWTNVEHHWERAMNRWIDVSRWYSRSVKERILTVDDKEYDDTWSISDKQFPTADAVRRFKRHRIIQRHWETVRGDVERGVVAVAFCGGKESEQHGGAFHQ